MGHEFFSIVESMVRQFYEQYDTEQSARPATTSIVNTEDEINKGKKRSEQPNATT